jgi:hypothetical protein
MTNYKLEQDSALPGLTNVRFQNKNEIPLQIEPGNLVYFDPATKKYLGSPAYPDSLPSGAILIGISERTQQDPAQKPIASVLTCGTIWVRVWSDADWNEIENVSVKTKNAGEHDVFISTNASASIYKRAGMVILGKALKQSDGTWIAEILINCKGGIK